MAYFTNSGLCYLVEINNELILDEYRQYTAEEIDNNFRLLYYSSSLHNNGQTLRLWRDIGDSIRNKNNVYEDPFAFAKGEDNIGDTYTLPTNVRDTTGIISDYDEIQLPAGGSGGSSLTIGGNTNNNILTATGTTTSIQGETNLKFDGSKIILTGSLDLDSTGTDRNVFIGHRAGNSTSTTCTVNIGFKAGLQNNGIENSIIGVGALISATAASKTIALGQNSLPNLTTGNFNTSIGTRAGECITDGASNVLLGYQAGPSTPSTVNNKLYINNSIGTPLIYGDFSTGHVEIKTAVSASLFSGSFSGDGSNLTGLNVSAFPYNGDAVITGSLTVSGSSVNVDLTNTVAVSGSVFSGSFIGDGSSLTGVTSNAFPHTGSAIISGSLSVEGLTSVTGSFSVSGSSPTITLAGITTIDRGIKIHRPDSATIGIGEGSLGTSVSAQNIALGYYASCDIGTSIETVTVGFKAGKSIGNCSIALGHNSLGSNCGLGNTAIGAASMGGSSSTGKENVAVGKNSSYSITSGCYNVGIGNSSAACLTTGCYNTALGFTSLQISKKGCYNTALGALAGIKTVQGNSNVYIGYQAGPSTENTNESNQLYINNAEGTPLIKGNFSTCQVEFRGGVTGSSFTGSFVGDGTNLTGITAEWDGSRNGDANVTGSFIVSGSTDTVDFTNVASISGSTFSGSFVGDGSGLTGVTGIEWDGSRNGDSNITGSLIVSGALDVSSTVTLGSTGYPGGPGVELIHITSASLSTTTTLHTFSIDGSNNYTGFKADYVLTDTSQASKKVGTLLAGWNPSAGTSVINEEHTIAEGAVTTTSFEVDASSNTNAIFKLIVTSGTFEINALITAFKRVV